MNTHRYEPPVFETLLCSQPEDHILEVRFSRPAVANALNTQMGRDVLTLFQTLILDSQTVRCVVLTGAGEKAFCAGGDLKERNGMSDRDWRLQHVVFEQAFSALMTCPIPVVAAVNGVAYGGGCELALACDFIYAAENARFALPETGLGIIPGGGGTQNLPRAVGTRRAREIIYTGAPFSAQEALAWGLVNLVTPPGDLIGAAVRTASIIARNAPIAVRQAKRAIHVGGETDLATGLALEIEAYNRTTGTADRREGIAAFNEKRAPKFKGQ